jgi:hypothetical protein
MLRTVPQGFDVYLERLTPLQTHRNAASAHRASIETSLKSRLSVLAIRETGSFTHGTGVRHHADVDILVSLAHSRPASSDTALTWVKNALQASFPHTTVRISRPAVVIEFAGGAETWEIIPGFITSSDGAGLYQIPGAAAGWIESAPAAHLAYVNDCNKSPGTEGGAKKLSRLIKAWKYNCSVPVSSFYLEMRAAQHMATQSSFLPIYDVLMLLTGLSAHSLAPMNDPKALTGRIHATSSEAKKRDALSKLTTAAARAQKALDAYTTDKPDDAFHYLDLLFGGTFPTR